MPEPFCFREALAIRLAGLCQLSESQLGQLEAHCELMLRWNRRMNLTAIKKPLEIIERHYCESVFLGIHLPEGSASVVDVGSGPGFPGLAVAVVRPDAAVTLVESHQRKAVFLREASRALPNVRVLAKRAEDIEESFDWVVSRAVDSLGVVSLLPGLGRRVALLIGANDAQELRKQRTVDAQELRKQRTVDAQGLREQTTVVWQEPIPLPWGERRVLMLGECSTWNT